MVLKLFDLSNTIFKHNIQRYFGNTLFYSMHIYSVLTQESIGNIR